MAAAEAPTGSTRRGAPGREAGTGGSKGQSPRPVRERPAAGPGPRVGSFKKGSSGPERSALVGAAIEGRSQISNASFNRSCVGERGASRAG